MFDGDAHTTGDRIGQREDMTVEEAEDNVLAIALEDERYGDLRDEIEMEDRQEKAESNINPVFSVLLGRF